MLETKRQWNDTIKRLKENYYQSRTLCPIEIFFKNKDEVKVFSDRQKLRISCQHKCSTKYNNKRCFSGKKTFPREAFICRKLRWAEKVQVYGQVLINNDRIVVQNNNSSVLWYLKCREN